MHKTRYGNIAQKCLDLQAQNRRDGIVDETDFTLLQAGGDNETISVYRQRHFPAQGGKMREPVTG